MLPFVLGSSKKNVRAFYKKHRSYLALSSDLTLALN